MPRFIRGGRGLWRNVNKSSKNGYSLGLSAIIGILLFIIDIAFFIAACCVGDFTLIFIFGMIAIIFIIGVIKGIKEVKLNREIATLNDGNSTTNQTALQISEEELFIQKNENKILKLSDELYFLIKKYASDRYPVRYTPKGYRLWWDEYEGSGNEFYLLYNDDILAEKLIARDGLTPPLRYKKRYGYYFERSYPSREQSFEFFTKMIKNKILETGEWDDSKTLNSFVYLIIRNGILRYFHDIYIFDYEQPSILDLCLKHIDDNYSDFCFIKFLYFCHDVFLNNIFLPLKTKRDEIYNEFDILYEKHKFDQYEKESNIPEQPKDQEDNLLNVSLDNEYNIAEHRFNTTEFKSVIQKIDTMTGRQFEEFIADFFKKKGYLTTLTPETGDFGIDIIIENDYIKIGIQTKCYIEKVSNSAVQEAVTGIRHYNLDKAMVVTNSYFQPSAITLAKDNNVILWDRDKLIKELSIKDT